MYLIYFFLLVVVLVTYYWDDCRIACIVSCYSGHEIKAVIIETLIGVTGLWVFFNYRRRKHD